MDLHDFVARHASRGACTCGKCFDAPANPEQRQPKGHTADLVFFKVASRDNPSAEEFRQLVAAEHPDWLDGREHSYLQTGADMGDQGIALMTMGLGSLLGTWRLLTPALLGIDGALAMQMAGMGMVTIQAEKQRAAA